MKLIDETVEAGARRHKACEILGLSLRTLQRWQIRPEDGRAEAVRPEPSNKLSEEEREEILNVINQPEYASLPPTQIVPRLADQGGTWLLNLPLPSYGRGTTEPLPRAIPDAQTGSIAYHAYSHRAQ